MLIDQMAINGMASSSSTSPFFPPNFLLQIQNNSNHHDPQEDHHQHQLQQQQHHHHQAPSPLSSLLSSNPQDYRSMATMLGKRSMSFSGMDAGGCEAAGGGGEEELSDDCSGLGGEKKRRLSIEQVRTLEKNFEVGNKLEPERKMQLARALGLQPRQVAIWFQNRRARWKTKQLEKDYDVLKRHFDAVKSENEALQAHNNKLQAEISFLKGGRETSELINLNKETEGSCSNRSENSSEINLDISRAAPPPAPTDSPPNPPNQSSSIPFFPATIRPPPTMVQLLQTTAASAAACPKIEHDENFSNLLCSMDDQSAFWPWSDPHSFH